MVMGKRGQEFEHGLKIKLGKAKKDKQIHPEKYCIMANCYNKVPCEVHSKGSRKFEGGCDWYE